MLAFVMPFLMVSAASCTRTGNEDAQPRSDTSPAPSLDESLVAPHRSDAVLYGLGLSTDPYGTSQPSGVGIVSITGARLSTPVEFERRGLQPDFWLGSGRAIATAPSKNGPKSFLLEYRSGRLTMDQGLRIPTPVWDMAISPNGKMIAYEPIEETNRGYTSARRVITQRLGGSARRVLTQGSFAGWTPTGEVLYWPDAKRQPYQAGTLRSIDPKTAHSTPVFNGSEVAVAADRPRPARFGDPVYSADGDYLAVFASFLSEPGDRSRSTIVILGAGGKVVRLLTSRLAISMFAWSPKGHRFAYTTSGFPSPHELFVLRSPRGKESKLLSKVDHFDWVTWSPTNRHLLVDDANAHRWLLVDPDGLAKHVALPRLGGRPMWCCPSNPFGTGAS